MESAEGPRGTFSIFHTACSMVHRTCFISRKPCSMVHRTCSMVRITSTMDHETYSVDRRRCWHGTLLRPTFSVFFLYCIEFYSLSLSLSFSLSIYIYIYKYSLYLNQTSVYGSVVSLYISICFIAMYTKS